MDSSNRCRARWPCLVNQLCHHHHHRHHHHYHIHFSPYCPLHSNLLQPNSTHPHQTLTTPPFPNPFNLQSFHSQGQETHPSDSLFMQEEKEGLEEEEEEPVFVLTDEWREFFAKSEAKRRLEKKQAKRKGKN